MSAAAFILLCAATAVAVAGAFGTEVVCALPFELADGGFTRMSVSVMLIVSAGVFTLVDFYFLLAGLQPAFEEAQQQAAARGVTMPQRRRLHHGWTWVNPLRRQVPSLRPFIMFASSIADSQRFVLSVPFRRGRVCSACEGEQGSFQHRLDAIFDSRRVGKVRRREYARSGNWTRPCTFMPLSSAVALRLARR